MKIWNLSFLGEQAQLSTDFRFRVLWENIEVFVLKLDIIPRLKLQIPFQNVFRYYWGEDAL